MGLMDLRPPNSWDERKTGKQKMPLRVPGGEPTWGRMEKRQTLWIGVFPHWKWCKQTQTAGKYPKFRKPTLGDDSIVSPASVEPWSLSEKISFHPDLLSSLSLYQTFLIKTIAVLAHPYQPFGKQTPATFLGTKCDSLHPIDFFGV